MRFTRVLITSLGLAIVATLTLCAPAAAEELKVTWKDGIRMDSEDGNVKLKLGGRIMSDWLLIDEDDDIEEALGNQNGGHEFRRARLYVSGELWKAVIFKAQYDFAGQDADFKDVYLGLKGSFGTLKMGHFKEPFSLEELTSSKYITFMERSLPIVFAPGRNAGVAYSRAFGGEKKKERGTIGFGAFKDAGDSGNALNEDDWAVTARVTGLPVYADGGKQLVHLGGSFRVSEPVDNTVRFRQRPEIHVGSRYVDTGSIEDVDGDTRFSLEGAFVAGRFSGQAEWLQSNLDAPGDPSMSGLYAYVSVFLTEDRRSYKNTDGAFSRVKPSNPFLGSKGGSGAWELAARYSKLDLSDGDIAGGELANLSVGVNWYLNNNTRFMFNWVRADLDQVGKTNGFMARFQVDF